MFVTIDDAHERCGNFEGAGCNWILENGTSPFCLSCQLNRIIPNLGDAAAQEGWQKIEQAKRRLVYELHDLLLPVHSKAINPAGIVFDLLMPEDKSPVVTGHAAGVITLNVREADSPFREQARVNLGEPYRTLLGHLRHEVGHYYWDRLVAPNAGCLEAFRKAFGDERQSYEAAMQTHYEVGAPPDWVQRHVSAYASMHPWEDWAETWAHYLHMIDAVDTAWTYGIRFQIDKAAHVMDANTASEEEEATKFDRMMTFWYPLALALNSLSRSMGHPDWYPFVLSSEAVEKLRFVDSVVRASSAMTPVSSEQTTSSVPSQAS